MVTPRITVELFASKAIYCVHIPVLEHTCTPMLQIECELLYQALLNKKVFSLCPGFRTTSVIKTL